MTTKEKMLKIIASMEDNASIDQVIDHLTVLKKIAIGLQPAEAWQCLEHDEFMDQLEREAIQ
jgi:hypothetical protein